MSRVAFDVIRPIAETWFSKVCRRHEVVADTPGYVLWVYERDAINTGTLEFVDDPELSQGHDLLTLSLALTLPPVRTPEDAAALFALSDWLTDVTIASKDFGDGGTLSVQTKIPLANVTEESLNVLFHRLTEAKRFLEDA